MVALHKRKRTARGCRSCCCFQKDKLGCTAAHLCSNLEAGALPQKQHLQPGGLWHAAAYKVYLPHIDEQDVCPCACTRGRLGASAAWCSRTAEAAICVLTCVAVEGQGCEARIPRPRPWQPETPAHQLPHSRAQVWSRWHDRQADAGQGCGCASCHARPLPSLCARAVGR